MSQEGLSERGAGRAQPVRDREHQSKRTAFRFFVDQDTALSHLSLRRHPNRSSAAPAKTHQLQLLDLPALWRPLGVLQGRNSSRDRSPREHYRVRLGRQDAQNSPVSQLWVRHTLGATKAKAKQLARGERTELRAKRARVCAYPSLRWS